MKPLDDIPASKRLGNLESLMLLHGSHDSREKGMCAAEAVAWLGNEPHSDHPQCLCPVIASFLRRLNDRMPDDETRTEILRPILPKLVGTRSTGDVEIRRAYLAADFAVRDAAPRALEATGRPELIEHAKTLRALPEVTKETDAAAWRAAAAAAARKESYRRAADLLLRMAAITE